MRIPFEVETPRRKNVMDLTVTIYVYAVSVYIYELPKSQCRATQPIRGFLQMQKFTTSHLTERQNS